ncbi:hypothetical protein CJD35_05010 [Sphingobium xenophagum]|jgi:hypothetical protein|uniref:Uncharacterized protein n=1 Tax=Sphingobium xenophagum TaxID=121428 RepID=A0A249MRA1_SPHXE|nr:hypothetical protein CJD35_05010 [Sphingobium xenophagum]
MRYPCGRNADELEPKDQMTKRLWDGYRRVMRGYRAKLKRLLAKGWTDSYGEKSTWQTSFGWLE